MGAYIAWGAEAALEPTIYPISGLFKVEQGPPGEPLHRALAAIDKVHGDGKRRTVPLVRTIAPLAPLESYSFEGYYRFDEANGQVIEISVCKTCPRPEFTAVHEIGHYLDHHIIGRPSVFASVKDPILDEWRATVAMTQEVRTLFQRQQDPGFTVSPDGVERTPLRVDQGVVEYLLQCCEVFARSYAQYIATASGDAVLLTQCNQVLRSSISRVYPTQWERDSFEPVREAMDKLFRRKGWRL
jgi:hypothetical protein